MTIKDFMNYNKLYNIKDLSNDSLYIPIKEAEPYFRYLHLERPMHRIRAWIKNGMLVGRMRNLSPTKNPKHNKWDVFLPDIIRFKNESFKGGDLHE
jgi:hypothetical protein